MGHGGQWVTGGGVEQGSGAKEEEGSVKGVINGMKDNTNSEPPPAGRRGPRRQRDQQSKGFENGMKVSMDSEPPRAGPWGPRGAGTVDQRPGSELGDGAAEGGVCDAGGDQARCAVPGVRAVDPTFAHARMYTVRQYQLCFDATSNGSSALHAPAPVASRESSGQKASADTHDTCRREREGTARTQGQQAGEQRGCGTKRTPTTPAGGRLQGTASR